MGHVWGAAGVLVGLLVRVQGPSSRVLVALVGFPTPTETGLASSRASTRPAGSEISSAAWHCRRMQLPTSHSVAHYSRSLCTDEHGHKTVLAVSVALACVS